MALAAGLIVVLIGRLFNRLAFDVGVSPRVKLQPIKPDPLFSNGEFADVRAYRLVEFVPAHAEVAVGITGPDESGRDWRYLGGRFVCHSGTAPRRAWRQKVVMGLISLVPDSAVDAFGFQGFVHGLHAGVAPVALAIERRAEVKG